MGTEIAVFDETSIRIGDPVHFPGVAQIEKEICLSLSPDFAAAGLSIKDFLLSMTNWTAGFLSEEYANATTDHFRYYQIWMETVPPTPGVFRATFGDSFGSTIQYSTPFSAGESPTAVMQRIIDQINTSGGEASFEVPLPLGAPPTQQAISIARVALEPPKIGTQFGPYLLEFGANGNDVMVGMKFEARTERIEFPFIVPPAPVPTLSEWGLILMSLLVGALGVAFLVRASAPALAGRGAVSATPSLLEPRLYARCVAVLSALATLGLVVAFLATGPVGLVDLIGLALCVPVAAHPLHLLILSRRDG
jgi:hypothetical protein